MNDEAVWTSWRPVAETYITKQKSLSLSAFPTEKRRLPAHFNFGGHGVILCRWCVDWGFPGDSDSKESAPNAQDPGLILSQEDPLMKGMATPSSILAWRIPWTEEPGKLQSIGSQRAGHDRITNIFTFCVVVTTKRNACFLVRNEFKCQ